MADRKPITVRDLAAMLRPLALETEVHITMPVPKPEPKDWTDMSTPPLYDEFEFGDPGAHHG